MATSSSSSSQEGSCDRFSFLTTDSFTISTPPLTPPQLKSPPPGPCPGADQAVFLFPNQDHNKTLLVRCLGPDVCPKYIRELFLPYGCIKSLRVLWDRDVDTIAAIEFEEQRFAEKAMSEIDKITRKNLVDRYGNVNAMTTTTTMVSGRNAGDARGGAEDVRGESEERQKAYEKISKEASPEITTIFCGFGFRKDPLSEQLLRDEFSTFGVITGLRCLKEKRYGFIRFQERISAIRAIHEKNGKTTSNGAVLTFGWGKFNTFISV